MPKFEKLMLVKCRPLGNQAKRTRGQLSRNYCEGVYVDSCFVAGVFSVKVGRVVIGKEHPDDDTEKPADFRH